MANLTRAALFLNGRYDLSRRSFYLQSSRQPRTLCVFADGGAAALRWLEPPPERALLIGDFDSADRSALERAAQAGAAVERAWDGRTDKDMTDGQLALQAALRQGCRQIDIHGAAPRSDAYDRDHYLGNLLLLSEAHAHGADARLSEPKEAVYRCARLLTLRREGAGLNRVSVLPLAGEAHVLRSEGLRWELRRFDLSAARANGLRNEFLPDAEAAQIQMGESSPPALVFHNWA